MNVNQVAFCTVTLLGVATAASAIAAATTAATVAKVAYAILAIGLAGASVGSITAWIDAKSVDAASYFETMKGHAGIAIAGFAQLFGQAMVQAVIDGLATLVRRGIAGPDHTFSRV